MLSVSEAIRGLGKKALNLRLNLILADKNQDEKKIYFINNIWELIKNRVYFSTIHKNIFSKHIFSSGHTSLLNIQKNN